VATWYSRSRDAFQREEAASALERAQEYGEAFEAGAGYHAMTRRQKREQRARLFTKTEEESDGS
jgi:IS5 family transposase